MLTFRFTNIVFGVALTGAILLSFFYNVPLWIFFLIVFLYSVIVFYGCYYIRSGFFMPIACSFQTSDKEIVISFDDGPLPQYTSDILGILKANEVPACFFCIGKRVLENADLIKQIHQQGHIIGNHSFSHNNLFDLWPSKKMLADMRKMDEAVFAAIGLRPKLFRPPYGVMNPNLKKAIKQGRYIPIGWNMRSFDTMAKDPQVLLKKLIAALKPGTIYLFHDSMQVTAAVLPEFLKEVKTRGYKVQSLDKVLNLAPYA